jgi:hypothetical protein
MPRSQVRLSIDLPDELLEAFLQHVRDFDARHSDHVVLVISVDAPHVPVDQIDEILSRVKPPFLSRYMRRNHSDG